MQRIHRKPFFVSSSFFYFFHLSRWNHLCSLYVSTRRGRDGNKKDDTGDLGKRTQSVTVTLDKQRKYRTRVRERSSCTCLPPPGINLYTFHCVTLFLSVCESRNISSAFSLWQEGFLAKAPREPINWLEAINGIVMWYLDPPLSFSSSSSFFLSLPPGT